MLSDASDTTLLDRVDVEILLDGSPINPPSGRRSIPAIRSFLETIALERQRVLCSFNVESEPACDAWLPPGRNHCVRVEAETFALDDVPLRLVRAALTQTADARSKVESALSLVWVNDGCMAHEVWWELVKQLKQPLLTLSLLPEPPRDRAGASVWQLRKWQLQQLGAIIREVDDACLSNQPRVLRHAIESRVLPWLESLKSSLQLLQETFLAAPER